MRFLRHDGIYRSDVSLLPFTPGACPASRSGRCQGIGHAGKNTPCPSSAMSSGRLFLDRVGRHQSPSPLHRHPQNNPLAFRRASIYHRTAGSVLTVCVSRGDKRTMALFAPDSVSAGKAAAPEPDLDESQKKAAHAEVCPLLVKAGPGTGKTRTLVGRMVHLLSAKQVRSEAILALTYSNKAAEEMRSRVGRVLPQESLKIWMGTFHAFGLEILRKYGSRLGLPSDLRVIDPVDALYMLETALASLDLDYYRDLVEPARFLPAILTVISRAKDELKGPAEYQHEAELMRHRATTFEEIETAEKASEVARVYAFYQQGLQDQGAADYGDLISRSVTLLQDHVDVREAFRKQYEHIVVDEYQDVNTASRMLLRHLAGAGGGLWVVGDQLQAIYRFRGAAGNAR